MNHYSRYELEQAFANDFESPLFPVLANLYYDNEEYSRALKVCKIGLKYDANNYIGSYVLSKVYLKLDKKTEAEKLLKNIIEKDVHNIRALSILVELEKKLNRSNFTIEKYAHIAKGFIKEESNSVKKRKNKPKKRLDQKSPFSINPKMVTRTMYSLLIKQKKYQMAYSILSVMVKQKKHKTFANNEIKKIEKHIIKKG